MFLDFFKNPLVKNERDKTVEDLVSSSYPRQNFFIMVSLSILMATLGLLMNNMSVVIGSMLVAPLLYPILAIALGIVTGNLSLIWRSTATLIISTFLGILLSVVVTLGNTQFGSGFNRSLLDTLAPSYLFALVAIVAGFAASIAVAKPGNHRFESFPGVAISVALIPPLAGVGIGLALLDWSTVINALVLYTINVTGILWSSLVVFILTNLSDEGKVAEKAVVQEEKNTESSG